MQITVTKKQVTETEEIIDVRVGDCFKDKLGKAYFKIISEKEYLEAYNDGFCKLTRWRTHFLSGHDLAERITPEEFVNVYDEVLQLLRLEILIPEPSESQVS